jgi:hypothetical protein
MKCIRGGKRRGAKKLFKMAVELLNAKVQATTEGLQKIINIRWGPPQRSWDPILAGGLEQQ